MRLGLYYRTASRMKWSQLLWRAHISFNAGSAWTGGMHLGGNGSADTRLALREDFPEVPLLKRAENRPHSLSSLHNGVFADH